MPRSRKSAMAAESLSTMESISSFGELLKYLRWRAGLTQRALGVATGYSESQIARLESGQRLPDVLAVKTYFVDALGLRLEPALAKRLVELATATHKSPAETVAGPEGEGAGQAGLPAKHHLPKHNLPLSLTRLIDREQNVVALHELLGRADTRLITLLGPPGVGKTSLAIEVARAVCDTFNDGVWFVPLAPVSAPGLVPTVIAQTLALPLSQADPLTSLKLYLRAKHTLLVLDNFEQLVSAATALLEMISAAPQMKILVTSRSALRVTGEYAIEVPPLGDAPALEMFVDRAQRTQPDFALTPQTRAAVTEICRHLDGIPLAIELAAACLRLFSPPALLERLTAEKGGASPSGVLDLLAEGPRNLAAHQRTLRATIGWSYDLLTASQQRLLRSLSVFAGGCTLEAAQAVDARAYTAGGNMPALITDLQALLDSSLVQRSEGLEGEPRFSLLEVIREFAIEQLQAVGEADVAHQRHSIYFLNYAKTHAPGRCQQSGTPFGGLLQPSVGEIEHWVKHMEQERDNFRVALAWELRDGHDTATGVQMALWQFPQWSLFGAQGETTEWLELALAHAGSATPARLKAAILALLSDYLVVVNSPRAVALAHEAHRIFMAVGDSWEQLAMLHTLMNVEFEQSNTPAAQAVGEEALALASKLGVKSVEEGMLFYLGDIALTQKDFQRAEAMFEKSLQASSDLSAGPAMNNIRGTLACYQGDYARAERLCRKALAVFKRRGFAHGFATTWHSLGDIALFQGDLVEAKSHFKEGLRLFSENTNRQRATWCLAGLAATAATAWHPQQAVTLWSAIEAVRAAIGTPRPPLRMDEYRIRVDAARNQLDAHTLAAAESAGRAMRFEQAVDYALSL